MREEQEVMGVLQDVANLLDRIRLNPIPYEKHYWALSQISDLASKYTGLILESEQREESNLQAMCVNASNQSSLMAEQARIKISGL